MLAHYRDTSILSDSTQTALYLQINTQINRSILKTTIHLALNVSREVA